MHLTVARQLFVMAVIVVISFFFSRKNKFGQKESQFLSRILLYVINPCMIVSTFDVDFDREKLKFLALAIGVSFAFHLVMIIMATVLFARKKGLQEQSALQEQKARDALSKIGIVFTNSGFIGIPLINGVFGGEGVFYLMGYILVFNILLWFWGEWIVTGSMRPLKILANPNVIACAAGLVVFCIPFRMPYAVIEPLRMIGSCNGAVSMMLLGLLFASFGGDKSGQEPKAAATIRAYARPLARDVALRLLACPLILLFATLFALRAFDFVHEIKLIMSVLFIAAACPVGMSVSSFAVVFKKDADYASLLVAVSSAACIVTIPLLVALLEALA
jgi:predicted permease